MGHLLALILTVSAATERNSVQGGVAKKVIALEVYALVFKARLGMIARQPAQLISFMIMLLSNAQILAQLTPSRIH